MNPKVTITIMKDNLGVAKSGWSIKAVFFDGTNNFEWAFPLKSFEDSLEMDIWECMRQAVKRQYVKHKKEHE